MGLQRAAGTAQTSYQSVSQHSKPAAAGNSGKIEGCDLLGIAFIAGQTRELEEFRAVTKACAALLWEVM